MRQGNANQLSPKGVTVRRSRSDEVTAQPAEGCCTAVLPAVRLNAPTPDVRGREGDCAGATRVREGLVLRQHNIFDVGASRVLIAADVICV